MLSKGARQTGIQTAYGLSLGVAWQSAKRSCSRRGYGFYKNYQLEKTILKNYIGGVPERTLSLLSNKILQGIDMSLINTRVPAFRASAFVNRAGKGEFIEVTDQTLLGKWAALIFMPAAFTFNCPTEIEDAADHYTEFQRTGAEVYVVTTDTHFAHKVWHETSPAVGKAKFPLIGDPAHRLTRAFGVHIEEEGLALRATFIISPDGVIKTAEIHDNAIARDVKETVRKLKAAQFVAGNPGQVCPAKWKEGAATIAPSLDLVGRI
jgi:peroxiredoxin (alkyl hydroperoxide reductase subunit C)